jgi:hypothetical protein
LTFIKKSRNLSRQPETEEGPMSTITQTLTAIAPDGSRHQVRTRAGYRYAGLMKGKDSIWSLVTKGWSPAAIWSRTRLYAMRMQAGDYTVAPLRDRVQLKAVEYFAQGSLPQPGAGHIAQAFHPGTGWAVLGSKPRTSENCIRRLRDMGYTHVMIENGPCTPDFSIEELLRPAPRRPLLGGSLIGSAVRQGASQ